MNDNDIESILKLLQSALKNEDWDPVVEAIEYLEDFSPDEADEDAI